jgi:hypothetical protein
MSSYVFQSASGYNNLPNGVFSPQLYSKKVQKQFRKSAVAEAITNNEYFGEIANMGDSVKIIKEPEITVTSYSRGQQITPQDLTDSDFILTVDRANSFAFRIDDIEVQQAHVGWMDMASNRAAYQLKDAYDEDILGYISGYELSSGTWVARTSAVGTKAESTADSDELFADHKLDRSDLGGGSGGDSIAIDPAGSGDATPLQILNRFNRILDQKNVPTDGRWLVVDPVFVEKLLDEDSKFMNHDYQGSEALSNGQLVSGKVRGFTVYMSNNLPYLGTGPGTISTTGSSTNFGVIVAGHSSAVATASQINKTEKLRDTQSFGDIVRGMQMYGRKILRPESVIRAIYNVYS